MSWSLLCLSMAFGARTAENSRGDSWHSVLKTTRWLETTMEGGRRIEKDREEVKLKRVLGLVDMYAFPQLGGWSSKSAIR